MEYFKLSPVHPFVRDSENGTKTSEAFNYNRRVHAYLREIMTFALWPRRA